jgi:hypothetical protein
MKIKQGVSLLGLTPQCVLGIVVAQAVFKRHGYDAVVTSVSDGIHKARSKHFIGNAFDLRTYMVEPGKLQSIVAELVQCLPEFDVVLESDHIHVEWDPVGKTS